MSKRLELTGHRYGRLVVSAFAGVNRNKSMWLCHCDCGGTTVAPGNALRTGNTSSCGCLMLEHAAQLNRTHGLSGTRTHRIWKAMWTRCTNARQRGAKHYVNRGIAVCDRWRSFEVFLADMGEAPARHSLDRIDVNGGYEPANCRWASYQTQARNARGKNGGHRGVHWVPRLGKYRAVICSGKQRWHLGVFAELEDALHARAEGERLHWRTR